MFDHPKFEAVEDWALQFNPSAKKCKKSIALDTALTHTTSRPRPLHSHCWESCRPWCPHILVGALGTVIGGVVLALILPNLGLDQQDVASKQAKALPNPPPVTEGWGYKLNRQPGD